MCVDRLTFIFSPPVLFVLLFELRYSIISLTRLVILTAAPSNQTLAILKVPAALLAC